MHPTVNPAKSYLFVPGDRPDRFGKAAAAGAHCVILDLEDAVAPSAKDQARRAVYEWAQTFDGPVAIRVNAAGTQWFDADIAMVAALPRCELMLPKSEPEAIASVARSSGPRVIALVETVDGLIGVRAMLAHPAVARLAFGNLDFALDLGSSGQGEELDFARAQLVLESRFARRPPPIDGVTVSIDDEETLARDLDRAKRFGFGAKLCIHPRQVAPTNARFRPTEAELAWADRVLSAVATDHIAVVSVDGKMVDRPVLERARAIVAQGL